MNIEQIKNDGRVLLEASAQCVTPTMAGFLRGRADEMLHVVKAWNCALELELDEATLDIVSASALDPGVFIVWPDYGRGQVKRISRDGMGINVVWFDDAVEPEFGFELPQWVNVLGPTSPVVVCLPPARRATPQMAEDDTSEPGDEVPRTGDNYGVGAT